MCEEADAALEREAPEKDCAFAERFGFGIEKGRLDLGLPYGEAAFGAVGIVTNLALVIEDHGGGFFIGEGRPIREAAMVGVAVFGEVDPGFTDGGAEFASVGTAAGHGGAAIGVIEDEWEFGTMEGHGAAVENGRLPLEPI